MPDGSSSAAPVMSPGPTILSSFFVFLPNLAISIILTDSASFVPVFSGADVCYTEARRVVMQSSPVVREMFYFWCGTGIFFVGWIQDDGNLWCANMERRPDDSLA